MVWSIAKLYSMSVTINWFIKTAIQFQLTSTNKNEPDINTDSFSVLRLCRTGRDTKVTDRYHPTFDLVEDNVTFLNLMLDMRIIVLLPVSMEQRYSDWRGFCGDGLVQLDSRCGQIRLVIGTQTEERADFDKWLINVSWFLIFSIFMCEYILVIHIFNEDLIPCQPKYQHF